MVIWVLAGYFVTFEQWKISRDMGNKWIFVRSEELQVSFELWRIGDWWWWRIGSALLFSRRFLAKTVRNKTLSIIHVANTDNFLHITPEDTTQKNLFLLCHHHTIKKSVHFRGRYRYVTVGLKVHVLFKINCFRIVCVLLVDFYTLWSIKRGIRFFSSKTLSVVEK